ncbi:unnamed protein product [Effrenium voratum]|nr:unnamed protein product [Effrenium voratum]
MISPFWRGHKQNTSATGRIFVLEDPNCEVVWKAKLKRGVIPEPEKTTWLDRCDLFPHIPAAGSKDRQALLRFRREAALLQRLDQSFPELGAYHQAAVQRYWHPRRTARSEPTLKGNEGPVCPTRNVFAVQTVLHHIPQLASRFVLAMPGDIAVRPTSVRTFFHGMKPRYPAGRGNLLYQNQSVAERLNAQIPRTTKSDLRVWVPLTKRLCSHIEQRYPLWLSFVRSHRALAAEGKGKFSSKLDASGTPASERANSAEAPASAESLQGVWWWYLTSHPHSGIRHHGNLFEERRLSIFLRRLRRLGWDPGEWELLVADPGSTIVSLEDRSIRSNRSQAERLLGSGCFACCWQLRIQSPGTERLAVLKHFVAVDCAVAAVFGKELLGQHHEQFRKEKLIGERLALRPALARHAAALISASVRFLGLPEAAPANQERMLVLQHAGQPLDQLSPRQLPEPGPVVNQLLAGVEMLRGLGVVHADISPSNCCCSPVGRVRLVDFGSALLLEGRRRGEDPRLERLRTRYVHHPRFPVSERYGYPLSVQRLINEIELPRGIDVYQARYDCEAFPGNLAATPPEMLRGFLAPQSDVYGLGILYWWMLTGEGEHSGDQSNHSRSHCTPVHPLAWPKHPASAVFVPERVREMSGSHAGCVEQSLQRAQQSMNQALLDLERQEAEKFSKVYEILRELSARQLALEQQVAGLAASSQGFQMVMFEPGQMAAMQPMVQSPASVQSGGSPQLPSETS